MRHRVLWNDLPSRKTKDEDRLFWEQSEARQARAADVAKAILLHTNEFNRNPKQDDGDEEITVGCVCWYLSKQIQTIEEEDKSSDGTFPHQFWIPALVIAVDHANAPPSYMIRVRNYLGMSDRETERDRLLHSDLPRFLIEEYLFEVM